MTRVFVSVLFIYFLFLFPFFVRVLPIGSRHFLSLLDYTQLDQHYHISTLTCSFFFFLAITHVRAAGLMFLELLLLLFYSNKKKKEKVKLIYCFSLFEEKTSRGKLMQIRSYKPFLFFFCPSRKNG